jgi:putative ABC transport system ATP-binding protein
MATNPLIRCVGANRIFVMGEQDFYALRDVTISIEPGELVAIVGASGSGKSSFLNVIGGLDAPSSGDIWIGEDNLAQVSEPELAKIRNEKIGFVFQQFNLLPRYDAMRNVELPLIYSGVSPVDRKKRSTELLRRLGLGDHLNKVPLKMSGGQQQRVAIARAVQRSADHSCRRADRCARLEIKCRCHAVARLAQSRTRHDRSHRDAR